MTTNTFSVQLWVDSPASRSKKRFADQTQTVHFFSGWVASCSQEARQEHHPDTRATRFGCAERIAVSGYIRAQRKIRISGPFLHIRFIFIYLDAGRRETEHHRTYSTPRPPPRKGGVQQIHRYPKNGSALYKSVPRRRADSKGALRRYGA